MLSRCFDLTQPGFQRQNHGCARLVRIRTLFANHKKPLACLFDVRNALQAKDILNAGWFMATGECNPGLGSHGYRCSIIFVCSCCWPFFTSNRYLDMPLEPQLIPSKPYRPQNLTFLHLSVSLFKATLNFPFGIAFFHSAALIMHLLSFA